MSLSVKTAYVEISILNKYYSVFKFKQWNIKYWNNKQWNIKHRDGHWAKSQRYGLMLSILMKTVLNAIYERQCYIPKVEAPVLYVITLWERIT